MSPPVFSFPAHELPLMAQLDGDGRRRKLDGDARRVDLAACELLRVVQAQCSAERPRSSHDPIRCWPVERLFRRWAAPGCA
ncbi:hypothetical protein HIM_08143 [Hirsutella minnesotensis 3608]|uniref:Uncharacterized protein n=1 Tax=Hirsutella minnesotensis 3608 TaxID=1043627 RepID=A0A0F8A3V2_9HYPO|nr:hypothetical protein HIM_08143 [Hirsutella minnesotensis 3608]